jgi:hypothetical protein
MSIGTYFLNHDTTYTMHTYIMHPYSFGSYHTNDKCLTLTLDFFLTLRHISP